MPTRLVRVGKIAPGTAPVWPHLGKRFCPPYAFRSEMSAHHERQRFLMTNSNQLDFSTRCIHAGHEPEPTTAAVMMRIYATSTYLKQSQEDHKRVAVIAKKGGVWAVADNTFATPYIQRPLELGFDLVVHSTTKYLNGHSDIIGGVAIVGGNVELSDKLKFLQNAVGAIQGPFDSFLALRGLKTLALRMERHCASALKIAAWLERHPNIRRVLYPGLASHPQHALAKKQMRGFGGMISAGLAGTLDDARRLLGPCPLVGFGGSPGRGESPIEHPR